MGKGVRIALVHFNRLFREGLALLLSQQHDLCILTAVAETREILGENERQGLDPDIIILALSQLGRDIPGVIRQLRKSFPGAKVLIMGLVGPESDILACIEAGAAGYLLPEASLEDLLNNIRAMMAGEALCSPKIAGSLFYRLAASVQQWERFCDSNVKQLTRREREIIALIEEGLRNKEIAVRLRIEIPTVKNHVHKILEKLQLDSRRAAARYAREHGLLGSIESIKLLSQIPPVSSTGTATWCRP